MSVKRILIIGSLLVALCFCQTDKDQGNGSGEFLIPTITSVLPPSVYADSPTFMLYVYGENFTEDSVILINNNSRPTTYVSQKELRCLIRYEDHNRALQSRLNVISSSSNPDPVRYAEVSVVVRNPGSRFSNSVKIPILVDGFISFTEPLMIVTHPSIGYFHPDMETDGQGNIYIVFEYTVSPEDRNQVYMVHSSDYGETWGIPVNISKTTHYCSYPGLAVDNHGNLLLVWQETDDPYYGESYIYYSRSRDQGVSWESPKQLLTGFFRGDNPAILVETGGEINVVAVVTETKGSHESIYFTRSTDNGQTWDSVRIDECLLSLKTPLVVDENSHFHITYEKYSTEEGSYGLHSYHARSSDHGLNWEKTYFLREISGLRAFIDLAIDLGGRLYVVGSYMYGYHDGESRYENYFSRSLTDGDTWDTPVKLDEVVYPTRAAFIYIEVDSKGNLVVFVCGPDIFLVRSVDRGDTWTPPIFITYERTYIYAGLDITCDDRDTLYVCWSDNRKIYFSRSE